MDNNRYKSATKVLTIADMSPVSSDSESVEHLRCAWIGVRKPSFNPETVFVMGRRNYKVYGNLGFNRRLTRPYAVIMDTRAGSSFIRKEVLMNDNGRELGLSYLTSEQETPITTTLI